MSTPSPTANLIGITGIARRLVLDGALAEADARRAQEEATKEKKTVPVWLAEKRLVTAAQIAAYKVSAQDAYLNGLKGDSSTQYISPKAQEAYNSGQIANKISHNATTIDTKDSIKNLSVSTYDGRKTVLFDRFWK